MSRTELAKELNVEELKFFVTEDVWEDEGDQVVSFLDETRQGGPRFIETGFKTFDRELDGLMAGGLHVIQGSSSIGKTTFCKQMADQVKMINPDLPIFFFSLEDSLRTIRSMTFSRLSHGSEKSIENRLIRKGGESLHPEDMPLLLKMLPQVKDIYGKDYYLVAGEPDLNVWTIRERVEKKLDRIGKQTALVVVDYLQILPGPKGERLNSLMDRIDFNLHELQCFARDINGPVIVTSSTTKEKEDAKTTQKWEWDKPGGLIAEKGSVNILHTPRRLFELVEGVLLQGGESREVKLRVLKNSEGPNGFDIEFHYFFRFSKFEEQDGTFPG